MLGRARDVRKRARACNIFLTVHNLGVVKKIKVCQKGPMYTHSDFRTSAVAKSVKRASMLGPITQASDILSKFFF